MLLIAKPEFLANLLIILIFNSYFGIVLPQNQNADSISYWWSTVSTRYPKYKETTDLIKQMATRFPNIVNYYSVGKSVAGRDMWVIHLSENINKPRELLKPMVKQVSTMHGDEVVGRALLLMLAVNIIKLYTEGDPRVVKLLKTTDIHLMPTVNPDGFEEADKSCDPDPGITGRRNKNTVDLNRDFPDQFVIKREGDPNFYNGRQPETINMMKYIRSYPFVLSSNLHGGDVVASYPFDSVPLNIERMANYDQTSIASVSPDDKVFKLLALEYSKNHKTMYNQNKNGCIAESFPEGITNGAHWYNVRGGMQDFNYVHSNCFEITLELSCCKYPPDDELISEWENNKQSLYNFMESAHMGAKGIVKSSSGEPIKNANIEVQYINKRITTTSRGEYWRLLAPGKYKIKATAKGFQDSEVQNIEIQKGNTYRLDFILHPNSPKVRG